MRATPTTTSPLPSIDAAPRRRRGAERTSPTVATVIGTPCGVAPTTTRLQIVEALDQAGGADDELLAVVLDVAAARVRVRAFRAPARRRSTESPTACRRFGSIDDLVLLVLAAEAVHLDDARDRCAAAGRCTSRASPPAPSASGPRRARRTDRPRRAPSRSGPSPACRSARERRPPPRASARSPSAGRSRCRCSSSNTTVTTERPYFEIERISSTFGIPDIARSTGDGHVLLDLDRRQRRRGGDRPGPGRW